MRGVLRLGSYVHFMPAHRYGVILSGMGTSAIVDAVFATVDVLVVFDARAYERAGAKKLVKPCE